MGGPLHRDDERHMRAVFDLARSAPYSSPNPQVAAIVVRDGRVIATAVHRGSGTEHAEGQALAGCDASGATLYVNLEPCAHHGKMPPCAPQIVRAGLARVVSALEDPDPRVCGQGHEHLRSNGIEVTLGTLQAEAAALNRPYLHHRRTGRPLVTLKLATTLDGYCAAPVGENHRITGPEAQRDVHLRRARVDAILVGSGTVVADDPQLTARDVGSPRQPVRITVDSTGRVPRDASLFRGGEAIVACTAAVPHDLQIAWKEAGAEVLVLPAHDEGVDLGSLIADLGERGMLEVYCEGGPRLATALLRSDLVDRVELYQAPLLLGGDAGPAGRLGALAGGTLATARRWKTAEVVRLGDDVKIALERP